MGSICGQTFKTNMEKSQHNTVKTNISAMRILKEDDVPGAKLTKPPEKCMVEELKRWLECHALKKSGKKNELILRVNDALKLNLPVDVKIDGGKWYNLKTESIQTESIIIYPLMVGTFSHQNHCQQTLTMDMCIFTLSNQHLQPVICKTAVAVMMKIRI